jgi:hypothetical protein
MRKLKKKKILDKDNENSPNSLMRLGEFLTETSPFL